MNTSSELGRPTWLIVVLCVALIGTLFPSKAACQQRLRSQEEPDSAASVAPDLEPFYVTSVAYLNLAKVGMSDVYGDQMIFYGQGGEWWQSEKRILDHMGFKGGMGFFHTKGRAIPQESDWQVEKAALSLSALHFYLSALYRLTGTDHPGFAVPYVGVGIGGIGGVEKLSMEVSKSTANSGMGASWDHSNLRASFESHVTLGLSLFANSKYKGLLELSYLFSGDSYSDNGELPQAMADAGFTEDVLTTVARPDFNFSGPTVSLGMQW